MKFIIAIVAYLLSRSFWGAIFGYFLGGILERYIGSTNYKEKHNNTRQYSDLNQNFSLNLLLLSALVIKADGKSTQEELNFVRANFIKLYGFDKANSLFTDFNQIKHQDISLEYVCGQIKMVANYEMRLQILHFLFGIAQSDRHISLSEIEQIKKIASALSISLADFQSIQAMFVHSTDDAYKILNISSEASDAEVKKAYREMAKKYHPDKVITDDPAIKKGAEEKFRKVQEAYEKIMKERGL